MKEHLNIVKAISWLKPNDAFGGFVSVSHDLTGILWQWDAEDEVATSVAVLRGHERGIGSVSVSPSSATLATGAWDTYLKIWSASLETEDNYEPHRKKTRGPKGKCLVTRTPLHTLKGHKENIVAIQWMDPTTVCSASLDHTIKLWDVEVCSFYMRCLFLLILICLSYAD